MSQKVYKDSREVDAVIEELKILKKKLITEEKQQIKESKHLAEEFLGKAVLVSIEKEWNEVDPGAIIELIKKHFAEDENKIVIPKTEKINPRKHLNLYRIASFKNKLKQVHQSEKVGFSREPIGDFTAQEKEFL